MDSKDLKKELEKLLEECGLNGKVIDGSFIEDEEAQELFGLSNKEIEEIYSPAIKAIQFCTDELVKVLKKRSKENN